METWSDTGGLRGFEMVQGGSGGFDVVRCCLKWFYFHVFWQFDRFAKNAFRAKAQKIN